MFDPPFRLQGVYASILYVYFRSKMQKKNSTCVSNCPLAKELAQQAWKIAQTSQHHLRVFQLCTYQMAENL